MRPVKKTGLRERRAQIILLVRAFEEGADDFVGRPFPARELVARLLRLLERNGDHR